MSDGVVGRVNSLQTLLSRDSDSNVGSLDHRDVVGTVTDGKRHDAEVVLDEVDDLGFLQRRDSAADDRVAASRQLKQQILRPLLREGLTGVRTKEVSGMVRRKGGWGKDVRGSRQILR